MSGTQCSTSGRDRVNSSPLLWYQRSCLLRVLYILRYHDPGSLSCLIRRHSLRSCPYRICSVSSGRSQYLDLKRAQRCIIQYLNSICLYLVYSLLICSELPLHVQLQIICLGPFPSYLLLRPGNLDDLQRVPGSLHTQKSPCFARFFDGCRVCPSIQHLFMASLPPLPKQKLCECSF